MSDPLLNALNRKLASLARAEGVDDRRAAVEQRIKDRESELADGGEDLSKLLKADLVARAEDAGHDTDGLTKAELVDLLEKDDT